MTFASVLSTTPIIARLLCAAGLLALALPSSGHAQDADLQRVKSQIVERLLAASQPQKEPSPDTKSKEETWMKAIAPDGQWSDIKYGDQTRGSWAPYTHLLRVVEMAKAYVSPANKLHGNPTLQRAIHSALGHWLEKDYRCLNWWYNDIGVPMSMAFTLILMEPDLSPDELRKGVGIIGHATIYKTGQNRVWLAGNVLMRALLENNAALAQQARDVINEEIVVTADDEGLQSDNSFHQHGPQLQLGNYGLSFASDGVDWLNTLRGTAWR